MTPRLTHKWTWAKLQELAGEAARHPLSCVVCSTGSPWWFVCVHGAYLPYENVLGVPTDPRGEVLRQANDVAGFFRSAEQNQAHYGRHGLAAFVAAYHENVVTEDGRPTALDDWEAYNALLDAEEKAKEAGRWIQPSLLIGSSLIRGDRFTSWPLDPRRSS